MMSQMSVTKGHTQKPDPTQRMNHPEEQNALAVLWHNGTWRMCNWVPWTWPHMFWFCPPSLYLHYRRQMSVIFAQQCVLERWIGSRAEGTMTRRKILQSCFWKTVKTSNSSLWWLSPVPATYVWFSFSDPESWCEQNDGDPRLIDSLRLNFSLDFRIE